MQQHGDLEAGAQALCSGPQIGFVVVPADRDLKPGLPLDAQPEHRHLVQQRLGALAQPLDVAVDEDNDAASRRPYLERDSTLCRSLVARGRTVLRIPFGREDEGARRGCLQQNLYRDCVLTGAVKLPEEHLFPVACARARSGQMPFREAELLAHTLNG